MMLQHGIDPSLWLAVDRIRRQELYREVERARLVRLARAGKPRLSDRILAALGDMLVSIGGKLRARCAPDVCCADYRLAAR